MTPLMNLIKSKRPKLAQSSVITYNSILYSLYGKVFGNTQDIDLKKYEDSDKILEYLKEQPASKRKTTLSALFVITDLPAYRNQMLDDIKTYNTDAAKQTMNDKTRENWVSQDEIHALYDKMKAQVALIYKKKDLDMKDLQDIQQYIILCLYSGIFIPPRRALDYCLCKTENYDTKTDNFYDAKASKFVFNKYKTSKFYNTQEVPIPKELKSILNRWMKHNYTDHLLFDAKEKPLTNVKLNQRIGKLFGKDCGVNILRKTYLTSRYGETIKLNDQMAHDMSEMGSSTQQQNHYVLRDP